MLNRCKRKRKLWKMIAEKEDESGVEFVKYDSKAE